MGGGSNAIGMFTAFVGAPGVELIGVEAGGRGIEPRASTARRSRRAAGRAARRAVSYLLQDADGQVVETHSISAGLDYPGVGPEHAYLNDAGLARYVEATDEDALAGFQALARTEGILPALEPAHVIGWLLRAAACPRVPGAGLPVGPRRQGPRHRAGRRWAARPRLMGALETALRAGGTRAAARSCRT